MPYPFVLPTTSAFSFSSSFSCETHPSLPLSASTQRGVVRDALKKHKRLPAASRTSNLSIVISSLDAYIPYLLTIDRGVSSQTISGGGELINVVLNTAPAIEWRPTLSGDLVPGRERLRIKVTSLEYEIFFILSTLGFAYTATARSCLQPLYSTTAEVIGAQDRTATVVAATKYLLDAATLYDYLATRSEQIASSPPCVDVAPATARAMASLALAEATLLAILKDDPYPAVVSQSRNKNDKDWMFKSPEIPKVRAHLYARLALAASEHAAKAASLCQCVGSGTNKINPNLVKYIEDLRRTSRAKACRFFGIDAELGGETADGIGWVRAGLQELGVEATETKKGLSFTKFKKDFKEKREDRRVDNETDWGADGGKLEETRILQLLDEKWNKMNDTMNTRNIPAINTLLAKMPSGRDLHTIKPYSPPVLDQDILDAMRAPPERDDRVDDDSSDDGDDASPVPIGAFPGTTADYNSAGRATGSSYY